MIATEARLVGPTHPAPDAAERLVDAVQHLSAVRSLDEVTDIVKATARHMTQADGATFVLRDGDQCHYADEDAIGPLWKGRRFPMTACISGWAMRHRQPAIVPDIAADDRIPLEAYRPTFVRSLAMVPIRSLDPIGAIGIYWATEFRPTPEAVRWLQSLADSTALAIEHLEARLELADVRYRAELLAGEKLALQKDLRQRDAAPLVKMCYLTKRFEVDGEWLSTEMFLRKRFGVDVTHGLCPEAVARLESDMLKEPGAN